MVHEASFGHLYFYASHPHGRLNGGNFLLSIYKTRLSTLARSAFQDHHFHSSFSKHQLQCSQWVTCFFFPDLSVFSSEKALCWLRTKPLSLASRLPWRQNLWTVPLGPDPRHEMEVPMLDVTCCNHAYCSHTTSCECLHQFLIKALPHFNGF